MALVAHWKCDDNAASTTVVATVGSNATLQGGDNTSAKTVAGPGGSITAGLQLNGTDDHIDISATGLSFANSTAYSVSIWFKRAGTIARLIGVDNNASGRIIGLTDTSIRTINAAGTSDDFTVPSMGTAAWHHLLLTRTAGNSGRVFLDGVESSTGALTVDGASGAWDSIGQNASSFTNGFSVAQVKIFDSDESANVATLYAEGVSAGGAPKRLMLMGVG
jgi:hypothetical protein